MATLQDVVNRYVSWEGRFWYGMEGNISDPSWGRLNPVASGYGDCSSTIWRAYYDILGVDVGRWTGQQKDRGTRLFAGSYTNGWNPGALEPGDLVLMGPAAGNITHVEMYVGGGQFSGHGGEIEPGPWRKNAADYLGRWPYWEARRYAAPSTQISTAPREDKMNNAQQKTLDLAASKIDQVWRWMGAGTDATEFYRLKKQLAAQDVQLAAMSAAITKLASGQGVSGGDVKAAIQKAVDAALSELEVTLTAGGKK